MPGLQDFSQVFELPCSLAKVEDQSSLPPSPVAFALPAFCYNRGFVALKWRYRLGVRTEDSQSSNPGSIPGSATNKSEVQRNLPALS